MRIAITGNQGQLASSLLERGKATGHDMVAVGRPQLDLAEPDSIAAAIQAARPDLVVSAAAYTAVDKAESEPDLATAINGSGAGKVAEAAAAAGVPVIHISTDYVFDGAKPEPYVETDATGPLGVYGASKLLGEQCVAAATDNHAILRVAWVYSPFGANFVKTMLRLGESRDTLRVVADQQGGPTSALDIADAILTMGHRLTADPSRELRGIFHLPPQGEATWADFASEIFKDAMKHGRRPVAIERIGTSEYPTPARRPANSRLSGDKMKRVYGVSLPRWEPSLDACIDRLLTVQPSAQQMR